MRYKYSARLIPRILNALHSNSRTWRTAVGVPFSCHFITFLTASIVVYKWTGHRTSNWDQEGDPPQKFILNIFKEDPAKAGSPDPINDSHIPVHGKGSSNGQKFTMHHGKWHQFHHGHLTFHIDYDDDLPAEKFSGHVNQSVSSIKGTITLRDPGSLSGPGPASGAYDDYEAEVSLS